MQAPVILGTLGRDGTQTPTILLKSGYVTPWIRNGRGRNVAVKNVEKKKVMGKGKMILWLLVMILLLRKTRTMRTNRRSHLFPSRHPN